MEESSSFVKATCQNYEVLVEDKHVGKAGGATCPLGRYDTRSGPQKNDGGPADMQDFVRQKIKILLNSMCSPFSIADLGSFHIIPLKTITLL